MRRRRRTPIPRWWPRSSPTAGDEELRPVAVAGYRRNIENHILPALGRVPLRRLRLHHLEQLYGGLLHPRDERAGLAPKSVYEIHLVIPSEAEELVAARPGIFEQLVALTPENTEKAGEKHRKKTA
ncbi:MAG: hypothetical protein ACRD0W_15505 [Acidimicrobiales bacterium]